MRGEVALVTIDNPPVNALGQDVREGLQAAIARLDADRQVSAVVVTGHGLIFVGGADIAEFDRPVTPPTVPDILNAIEGAAKPWIAAINGAALGGGLELALACHWRLAGPAARLALPEINLGITPGAGGTQRLPRLVGVDAAVSICCENRSLTAVEALEIGLIDRLVEADIVEAAQAFARGLPELEQPLPAAQRAVNAPTAAEWTALEQRVQRRARGSIAPLKALEALRIGVEQGYAAGAAAERAAFLQLRQSEEAAALRYLFFAERAAAKRGRGGEGPRQIRRAAVIGGGTMGIGIAAALLDADIAVALIERDQVALDRAMGALRSTFQAAVTRGKLTQQQADHRAASLEGAVGYDSLVERDLVIEAVFEDITVKQSVFADLSAICGPQTILATNTSYLDPRRIAEEVSHPERFIGLHFFSPAQVMKLLEIVPIPQTQADVVQACFELANRLGKVAVPAGICEGFIGNRMLLGYRAEAETMVREGNSIARIDAAMRQFGFAMGPFEMQDMAGLDIAFRQREAARANAIAVPETLGDLLVRAGRLGVKSGGGWYDYREGDRKPVPSEAANAILAPLLAGGVDTDPAVLAHRLVAALSREGEKILAEGIAATAEDIDLVQVHGYGFPRFRGGPMFFAKNAGETP